MSYGADEPEIGRNAAVMVGQILKGVESECGAVALGRPYLFPPLSSGGALVARP